MSGWEQIVVLAVAIFLIWWLWRMVKRTPQAFSKANFSKSLWTMGWIAIILIVFVAILVFITRH